jgi:DNA mismatch endonuclease (patch repair protein)
MPGTNIDYWEPKIAGNRARDAATDAALKSAGWQVLRVWEHDDPSRSAARVREAVDAARRAPSPGDDTQAPGR